MGMVHWYTWHYLTSWDSSGESPLRRLVAYDLQVPYAHQAIGALGGGSVEEFPPWSHFDTSMVSTTWVTKKSNSWLGPILVIWSLWHAWEPMFPYKKIGIPWARTGGIPWIPWARTPASAKIPNFAVPTGARPGRLWWLVCLPFGKISVFFQAMP